MAHTFTDPVVTGAGAALPRVEMLRSLFSTVYDTRKTNISGLITAIGYADEIIGGPSDSSQIRQVRLEATLERALGVALNKTAAGYGVYRYPTLVTDERFRDFAISIAQTVKATRFAFDSILGKLLDLGCKIYETIKGKVFIEYPASALMTTSTQESASYFKTNATVIGDVTKMGDYMVADHTSDWIADRGLVWYSAEAKVTDTLAALNEVKAAGVQITLNRRG